uniref:Uncharacterized protein n=1 Tax=candidate division CPR3 bacterium TaxID=2268181 RepID=A0A7C4M0P9_UNCC3
MKKQDNKNSPEEEFDSEFLDLVDYIKENKSIYGIDKLRKGLLQQGVDYNEIKRAIDFIEEEDEKKIAGFLGDEYDDDEDEIKENTILELGDELGENKVAIFKKRADKIVGSLSTSFGGDKKTGKIYLDVFKYGAVSFLFFSIIVYAFKLLGGAYVYPRIPDDLGTLANIAVPNVFLVKFSFWQLLSMLIWSALWGGIIVTLFIKYLSKVWPFSNWFSLQQKLFAFFAIYEFLISVVIFGLISSISWLFLFGYLIITMGIAVGSYLTSFYLANVLEKKYEDKIRHLIR